MGMPKPVSFYPANGAIIVKLEPPRRQSQQQHVQEDVKIIAKEVERVVKCAWEKVAGKVNRRRDAVGNKLFLQSALREDIAQIFSNKLSVSAFAGGKCGILLDGAALHLTVGQCTLQNDGGEEAVSPATVTASESGVNEMLAHCRPEDTPTSASFTSQTSQIRFQLSFGPSKALVHYFEVGPSSDAEASSVAVLLPAMLRRLLKDYSCTADTVTVGDKVGVHLVAWSVGSESPADIMQRYLSEHHRVSIEIKPGIFDVIKERVVESLNHGPDHLEALEYRFRAGPPPASLALVSSELTADVYKLFIESALKAMDCAIIDRARDGRCLTGLDPNTMQ
ncbi:hypothetical protein CALVIDRAFT_569439 [Calocera viscosa TUFC12733]|uniref:Uncharacterized protein n=1 Tax=Calocera viscosa (strain TUFC12733) TaxID=1330018 RepID=A0A167FZM7_CALVF|nr:hypothetical protein CALVIDRAFT_569439 [Calocera viscosa TUFC12733]